nr:SDR family NAD(P)-dependent oxidoreductase [Sporomusa silvacetica]
MRDITGRNATRAQELLDYAAANKLDIRILEMDILSQQSVDSAVQTIITKEGHLDVVIHNAGHLVVGDTEAFTPEEIMVFTNLKFKQ